MCSSDLVCVLRGGDTGDMNTWEWDGRAWITHAAGGPGPAFRDDSMAFDSVRSKLVLIGSSGVWTLEG